MRGVSKRCFGTSGELKLVSKHSGQSGPSMVYDWNITIYAFYRPMTHEAICASVQPTALEKPSSRRSPNKNVKSKH